tara:strand:- start:18489 stop:18803 length:315 start_codon:yes stop_codon:yes gene_type:complete
MKIQKVQKVNRASDDIWKLLRIAVDTKNWALLEKNLDRLHALQRYYCQTLTNQSGTINVLTADNEFLTNRGNRLEDENIILICKDKGFEYQTLKTKLDELFKEG